MKIPELIEKFLAWCGRHKQPATVKFYRSRLKLFGLKFADRTFASLTPLEVDEFLGDAGAGKSDLLPAPVVQEYLGGFAKRSQAKQIKLLQELFQIPGLDAQAAALAAELESGISNADRAADDVDRPRAKVDAQVVAIAIVAGATKIVTGDVKFFRRLAKKRITVIEVPNIERAMTFPFKD